MREVRKKMHKQIVEKYKYNNLSRLLAILANTVPLILGIIFLLLSEYTLLQFMGVLLIAMFSCMILSLCLFKCLLK
jgi:predicted RND superfamily exporter protein